jgi:hypothetical protein
VNHFGEFLFLFPLFYAQACYSDDIVRRRHHLRNPVDIGINLPRLGRRYALVPVSGTIVSLHIVSLIILRTI